jgi:Icc-related predicted phosphoesterase
MTRTVFISDTHARHNKLPLLPDADILIHCGDISSMGYEHEIKNFLGWFSRIGNYTHRIFVAGNHDWLFQTNGMLARSFIPRNIIYLEDNGVTVEGLNIYGTPVCPIFYNWAFMRPETTLKKHWLEIPDDTDILITHSPANGILDFINGDYAGSASLYHEVTGRLKSVKIHAVGHIHSQHGTKTLEGQNTLFINASNLNDDYVYEYPPIMVDINDGIASVL